MTNPPRTRLIRAASECIAASGVRGLRVSDVAKHAGVSAGLIYYHFTDRDGLIAATLAEVNAGLFARLEAANTAHLTPQQAHELFCELLREEFRDTHEVRVRSTVWNELKAIAVFDSTLAAHLSSATRDWNAALAALLARAHPEANVERVETLTEALTAAVEGLASRWLNRQLSADAAQAQLDVLLTNVLRAASMMDAVGGSAGTPTDP